MASSEEGRRSGRTRTLTEKGIHSFEQQVSSFTTKLLQAQKDLETVLNERVSPDSLVEKRALVDKYVSNYDGLSCEFLDYLKRVNTLDSKRQIAAHTFVRDSVISKAHSVLRGFDVILRTSPERHGMSATGRSVVFDRFSSVSGQTRSSSAATSSFRLKLKATMKLQAEKTEWEFSQREAALKRAKAKLAFNQSNLDTDIEILDKEKKVAMASAEYDALCRELDFNDLSCRDNNSDMNDGDNNNTCDMSISHSCSPAKSVSHESDHESVHECSSAVDHVYFDMAGITDPNFQSVNSMISASHVPAVDPLTADEPEPNLQPLDSLMSGSEVPGINSVLAGTARPNPGSINPLMSRPHVPGIYPVSPETCSPDPRSINSLISRPHNPVVNPLMSDIADPHPQPMKSLMSGPHVAVDKSVMPATTETNLLLFNTLVPNVENVNPLVPDVSVNSYKSPNFVVSTSPVTSHVSIVAPHVSMSSHGVDTLLNDTSEPKLQAFKSLVPGLPCVSTINSMNFSASETYSQSFHYPVPSTCCVPTCETLVNPLKPDVIQPVEQSCGGLRPVNPLSPGAAHMCTQPADALPVNDVTCPVPRLINPLGPNVAPLSTQPADSLLVSNVSGPDSRLINALVPGVKTVNDATCHDPRLINPLVPGVQNVNVNSTSVNDQDFRACPGTQTVVNPVSLGTNFGTSVPVYSVNSLIPGSQTVPDNASNMGATAQYLACSELSKFLIKKDLLLTRLTIFDERAETYLSWKNSFLNVMSELSATPSEQLDLLIKYLGKDSARWAMTLKASNTHMPERALFLTWERLDERFGSPEFLESALKSKLAKFPKIAQNQMKRLYDLSDILSEINSVMDNPLYRQLFSYYDTSAGVKPVIAKLPTWLQNKWMSRVMQYKTSHGVVFPPFSVLCTFIREMSTWCNDPAFSYQSDVVATTSHVTPPSRSQYGKQVVSTKKTEVGVSNRKCVLHQQSSHTLKDCKLFRKKSLQERKKILRENHICFKCCDSNSHGQRDCPEALKCDICSSESHPTALHIAENHPTANQSNNSQSDTQQLQQAKEDHGGETKQSGSSKKSVKCTNICGKGLGGRSCAKIVPVRVFPATHPDKAVKIYAILDDQSNGSLARSMLFDIMDLTETETFDYTLTSCSGREDRKGRRALDLMVQSLDGNTTFKLPPIVECDDIPNERQEIPTPEITTEFEHLRDIHLPPLDPDADILLLIGRDMVEAHVVLDQLTGARHEPFAQRLALGWVVIGSVCLDVCHPRENVVVAKTHILGNGRPTSMEPCCYNLEIKEKFPTLPDIGNNVFQRTKQDDKPGPSIEDQRFLELMDREFSKDSNGHWTAPLPFRPTRPRLPNNRDMALKRAKSLQASLKKNALKKQHFVSFMHGMLELGHAEIAPPVQDDEEVWYLPVFGVYHPKKKDKIRVVFDSSATYCGLSLNGVLMTGPDMTNNLVGVLLRFRKEAVAIVADIEKMFYGFYVHPKDRNYLRFLWHRDNNPELDFVEYRMCVHVFGNSPSPAVATYGLRRCAQAPQEMETDDVVDYVTNNFYVDDGLASFPSAAQALDVLRKTQHVLDKEGKLRLHKVASNSQEVLSAIPTDDLTSDLKNLDFLQEKLPSHYSLGLCWNISEDAFVFNIPEDGKPSTRRGILSTINSLFDPLGFLAPVTIQGKIFLRDITADTKDWDRPITEEVQRHWETWKASLKSLDNFMIPRCYIPSGMSSYATFSLHIFCDASEKAIAAVAYIRAVDQAGQVHVGFICGKSKVAPKHGHTIPRLELCAAVLAVELSDMVSEQLVMEPEEIRFHTDSQVVLGYLYNEERRFFTYVSNRVGRIRKSTDPIQWSYVPTGENPADDGTRQVPPEQIMDSMWIKGPPFLAERTLPQPDSNYSLIDVTNDKEIKPSVVTLKTNVSKGHELRSDRFKRFSSWSRLVSVISLLRHVASSFKTGDRPECRGWHTKCGLYSSPGSLSMAERQIIMECQRDSFPEETDLLKNGQPLNKNSPVLKLSPYLDDDGLVRVGGRLKHANMSVSEKNPILVSGRHHIASLLIHHYHRKVQHQGRHFTEGAVRSAGYWITGGKRLISSLIFKCVKCRKMRAKLCHQKMADLPLDRITPSPPFTFVGVDAFGPWEVSTRRTRGGSACSKRWGILFTCLGCRAIHIELVEEMSTSSFINALRRLYALRGPVSEFRSDRGSNFVGSIDELRFNAINVEDSQISNLLRDSRTIWRFNPAHSSHMGGPWERMINTVRRILDSILMDFKGGKLTHEVLSTFMAEVSAIVNSRPLVPVPSDAESPFVLSPALLLTQKSGDLPEHIPDLGLKDMYRSQWRFVQVLANTFWTRWRNEYLQSLQPRRKWKEETPNLQEGNIVLLRDKEVHRNHWPLGVVEQVFPSTDGLVRKLEVRVVRDGKTCRYVRPVTEIVKLVD